MKRVVVTAVPPDEIREIARRVGANVGLSVIKRESFHCIIWYHVLISGPEEEIERFMNALRLSRAGA
ncbi:TIGR04140 family protein [Thermococcus sp.]